MYLRCILRCILMIKNRLLLQFLYFAGKTTDSHSWAWFHEFFRYIQLLITPYLLRCCFKSDVRNNPTQVIPRHSVVKCGEFNVFLSDFDFTVLYHSEPSFDFLQTCMRRYCLLKIFLPYLGEVEIYTTNEFLHKTALEEKNRSFLDLHWNLRKWVWQFNQSQALQAKYHQYKITRSIHKIKKNISFPTYESIPPPTREFSKFIEDILPQLFSQSTCELSQKIPSFSGPTRCFGWLLQNVSPAFVAALPEATETFYSRKIEIELLREQPDVNEAVVALAAQEILFNNTNLRTKRGEPSPQWIATMSAIINKYHPELMPPALASLD